MGLREERRRSGLSQSELANRSGVSRQLVGAVEAGRHLPRVDAAIRLATALGTSVEDLFPDPIGVPVGIVGGEPVASGTAVRVARVGTKVVATPTRRSVDGWDVADVVVGDGDGAGAATAPAGFVVAGCEPGLELLERLLRESGIHAVAASASSATAAAALREERAHAAVVHGRRRRKAPAGVVRFGLSRWRVGLAGPRGAVGAWWRQALAGEMPVAQREPQAAVQQALSRAATSSDLPGPTVATHLEAAHIAATAGMAGITIEPAALAADSPFHPLERHQAELWVDERWLGETAVEAALDTIVSARFQRRLAAVGGYDLAACGERL